MSDDGRFMERLDMRVSVGGHSSPADGTCLMELASVIAGEPFNAHPRCVHPTLAALARLVNDNIAYTPRQRLIPLLPAMMTYTRPDPMVDWSIIVSCLESAQQISPGRRRPRQLNRARRRLARLEAGRPERFRLVRRLRWRTASFSVVSRTAWIACRHGGDALVELLTNAVAAYTGAQLRAELPPVGATEIATPRELAGPVRS